MDTKTEQLIVLAKINQIKDVQIFALKEEEKLREELARLVSLSDERRKVFGDDLIVAFKD